MPLSREKVRRRRAHEALERGGTSPEGGDRPSSEAEPRSRGCPAPDRGGTSPEGGVTDPRARRNLSRGGARPPSEAEACPCSAAPLERSGILPEGGWAVCLVGRRGHQSRGPSRWAVSFILRFVCVLFFYKRMWVFPGCLGDPYGCPL
jgi:hypothetical protein